jgi:GntR family transcriptional regulator, transcriptional repressor for pyruvate dehydrogenase complex
MVDLGPQITKVAISDELIVRFKDLISRGVFRAGDKLPAERELAEALAVSRPTVRQALRALQIMGVVRSRQGSGSYLASSATDILRVPVEFALAMKSTGTADLFETRKTIEVKLAELAASRRNEGDLDLMRTALARMRASMGIPDEWCIHEIRFHHCIVVAAKNGVMTSIMDMLSRMLIESRKQTIRILENYPESYRSHENVFLAIEKSDPVAASEAMIEHFAVMEQRAKEQVGKTRNNGAGSTE